MLKEYALPLTSGNNQMPILSQISVYPIKSAAGIDLSTSWVDSIGLPFDRRFVVSEPCGQFITARTMPKLCLIQANLTPNGLILTAPDMPLLVIEYDKCLDQYQAVNIWKDNLLGQRCQEQVDAWFSQYLNRPCHLLYFGEQSSRTVANSTNPVAFADGYPLLLISQASLTDLNARLTTPVTMRQFRPNIVVDNCLPFAEDNWQHIRIGEVEFEVSKPCSRCIFTTVNPQTAEKHHLQEPLATLKSYRQVEGGDVMFGQNLIPLNKGQIKQGDTVTVLKNQTPPLFLDKKSSNKKSSTEPNRAAVSNKQNNRELPLTCVKIVDETHDVKTFTFKAKQDELSQYSAGQHLPFKVDINGKKTNAVYTLSSAPTRPSHYTITIKRVPNGKVSNFFHDNFNVGDSVIAKSPNGKFHIDAIDNKKLLLLSGGSGITPMLSMLKTMVDLGADNNVVFFHSARSEQDIIARDEVQALAKQHGNCHVSYTLTQSAKPNWQDYQGHLSKEMLANIEDLTQREVMVCGPEGFRETAKAMLFKLGLPEAQFHFESFGGRKSEIKTTKKAPAKVNISFDSWNKHFEGNSKETLLEQGEAAGLILPYSCRGGMCGSCKVKLASGEVKPLADDGLLPSEKEQGYILSCSCIPQSDVVITKV